MPLFKPVVLRDLIKDDLRRNFGTSSYPPDRFYYPMLADFWLAALLFYPLAIAVFRGTWQCLDHLAAAVMPPRVATYVCLFVGAASSLAVTIANYHIDAWVQPPKPGIANRVKFFLYSRGFTIASLLSDIILWKGFWEILDDVYAATGWKASLLSSGVVLALLTSVGSLRAVMGTPLGTGFYVDADKSYLFIPTMWNMELNSPLPHRTADALVSLILTLQAIVAYHGPWKCEEDFIAKYASKSTEVDAVALDLCLIAFSVSLSVWGFVCEFGLLWLHAQPAVPEWIKLFTYQAMLLLTYFADVTLFCAVWHILDETFLPENQVSNSIISHHISDR